MRSREHLLVALALLIVAVGFAALATGLSRTAAMIPLSAALLTAVLVGGQLAREWRGASKAADSLEHRLAVGLLLLLAALYVLGFAIALPGFALLYWRVRANASWIVSATVAAGVFAFLNGLTLLLRVDLYPGILWTR